MKEFSLNKVKYKNIMSVGQQPIEVDLSSFHKTLVTGVNGAGKSTIIEAITFGLFGKSFRDLKLSQLINSQNKKDLLVELWISYNNKEYYIKRGQKPSIFEIHVDGQQLDQDASSKDLQEKFEAMISMSYASFKQVVILGTAGYTPFMQLSKPERRKLVEDLLEVSVLAEMDKLNKTTIREINSNISVLDMKKDHIQTEINTHLEYAEKQRKLSGDNVNRLQTMLDETMKQLEELRDKNIAINEKIASITVPEDPGELITEAMGATKAVEAQVNTSERVISLYAKGGSCPTCLQQLEKDSWLVNKVKAAYEEQKVEHAKHREEWGRLCDIRKEAVEVKRNVDALRNEAANNKQVALSLAERAKKIKGAMQEAQKEVIDNSEQIAKLVEQRDALIEEKSSMVMEKYHRSVILEMLKDSGIKGSIVKKYVPLFNKQINKYLDIMGADYTFTLDEEFVETIRSRGRESFTYNSFSQGEKTRIDIALLFTWRNIASMVSGVNIQNLILDEVADGAMDSDGIKAIKAIMDQEPNKRFVVISHRDHNPDEYGQHVQMKKVGRFTVKEQ